MSREIKFRYKIKGRKKLLYDTDDEFGYLQRSRNLIAGTSGQMLPVEAEMQYTGLKDKAINEIYDGDIVRITDWGGGPPCTDLGTGQIIFDEDEGCWQTHPPLVENQYEFYTKCAGRGFEVIGNVHETPELVEEK